MRSGRPPDIRGSCRSDTKHTPPSEARLRRLPALLALILLLASLPTLTVAAPSNATRLTLELQIAGEYSTHYLVLMEQQVHVYSDEGYLEGVYTTSSGTLHIHSASDGAAMRLNRNNAAKLAAQLSAEVMALEDSLATLTPEQQAVSRLRMAQLFNREGEVAAASVDMAVEAGADESILGIACKGYLLHSRGALAGEACFAPADAVPHGAALADMLALMHDLYTALQEAAPAYVSWVLPTQLLSSLNPELGIPLRLSIVDDNGTTISAWRMTDLEETSASPLVVD